MGVGQRWLWHTEGLTQDRGGDGKGVEDLKRSWRRIHRIGHTTAQNSWAWEGAGVCRLILTRKPSVQVKSSTETQYLTGSRGGICILLSAHSSADCGTGRDEARRWRQRAGQWLPGSGVGGKGYEGTSREDENGL